jgi:hypothetical protein
LPKVIEGVAKAVVGGGVGRVEADGKFEEGDGDLEERVCGGDVDVK